MQNSVRSSDQPQQAATRKNPHRVCPWWIGYMLASPVRRLFNNPARLLGAHVRPGMTVLEPGPGMGFFTLELARLVGDTGRVIAVDIQARMLAGLRRRAARAGLLDRVEARQALPDSLGLTDLAAMVDFTLAYAVVHELPAAASFFREVARASKLGARLLLVEPKGHVSLSLFGGELRAAGEAGFKSLDSHEEGGTYKELLERV
ncbi:MAG TPA: methyltransferase domain-containing protein [Bryobacteraceae bacterium]|nr:methyltransferase domain-containing protein [Bryobacteraceae bacterium]